MQTGMQTSMSACEKQMCGGITVNCCCYRTLSDKVLSFSRRATVKRSWLCLSVTVVARRPARQGRVCFNPEVFTWGGDHVSAATWKLLKLLATLSDNHMERIHHFEGSFTSSGGPRTSSHPVFLPSCPLCGHHSLPCVWVTPTLTVIWALNIVLAFNTFQKWRVLLLSANNTL